MGSKKKKKAPPPKEEQPEGEPETLESRIKDIHAQLTGKISAEANGLLEILGSRRRLMWVNFLAGLARGVGFFLGVTLIGALVLAMLAFFFNTAAERLGYKDITLDKAVRSAVAKFTQIQQIVGQAKDDLEVAQTTAGVTPPSTGPTGATGSTGDGGADTPPDQDTAGDPPSTGPPPDQPPPDPDGGN